MGSNGTNSHVDVVNPLVSGCLTGQLHALFRYFNRSLIARSNDPTSKKKLPSIPNKTLLQRGLLYGAISSTASLGIFEILTMRLRNGNEGRPLSLYQEACCGLISGTSALVAPCSFKLACNRVGLHKLFPFLQDIQIASVSPTLRIGSITGLAMATIIAAYTGMLASYDLSRNYLIQTQCLSKWNAQIYASIIAGFFGAACAHPIPYLGALINVVETRHIPHHIIQQLVQPRVYTRFLKRFSNVAQFTVVHFAIYETVRGVEWTNIQRPI